MSSFESYRLNESNQKFAHPHKAFGEIRLRGWEDSFPWAIDANGQCWEGEGLSVRMCPCESEFILNRMDIEGLEDEANEVRKILGLGIKRPAWMTSALEAGWEPPEAWVDPEDPTDSRPLQVQGGVNPPSLKARGMKRAMELARRTLQTTPESTREIILMGDSHNDPKLLVTLRRESRPTRRDPGRTIIVEVWETKAPE